MPTSTPANPGLRHLLTVLVVASLLAACGGKSSSSTPPVSSAFTLHYHRAAGDYAGWTVETTAGAVEASVASTSTDGWGAVYGLTLKPGATSLAFSLKSGSATDPAGPLTVDVSGTTREARVLSGWPEAIARTLPAVPASKDQIVVYYGGRSDNAYTGWGLHLWGDQVTNTSWSTPLQPVGIDSGLGAGFVFDLKPGAAAGNCSPGEICVIAHKFGPEAKDPGPDMHFDPKTLGNVVFLTSGSATFTAAPVKPGTVTIAGASAHLIARDTVAWNVTAAAATSFELRWSPTAAVGLESGDITGGTVIALTPRAGGLTAAQKAAWPQLQDWRAFEVAPADQANLASVLKGQLVAVARGSDQKPVAATAVQTAGAIDDLFATTAPLGVTFATVAGAPTLALWAPTAQSVKLHVHDATPAHAEIAGSPFTPTVDAHGVWSTTGPAAWYGNFYRYELQVYHPVSGKVETLTVTDPYAVNLSSNSQYAQILDLADPALQPAGWSTLVKPPLAAPEDIVVYESHVRDFSAFDASVAAERRGKYLAFAPPASGGPTAGQRRLGALAAAGLTHVHLLPAFDIATIDENPANRVDLGDLFATLCLKNTAVPATLCTQFAGKTILEAMQGLAGDAETQAQIASFMRQLDSFNWGYDPLHFGAPEGSYASSPEGTARVVEFRRMVQGINELGLRVVMDVVYNHTNAAGVGAKSVLDKVVPGYYHRLDPVSGSVLTSSCCANTATEHVMMGRLMTDTMIRWARDYKVDGFRWDLMGLHLKKDVLATRDAVAALTPGSDGVDGSKIYLYGEGWDMGELQNGAWGPNATQVNMAGTGIGTFNDRIRDAVRGGSAFDSGPDLRKRQGFANGLVYDANEAAPATSPPKTDADQLGDYGDWIKVGLAGSLREFRLVRANTGAIVAGGSVGYNGAPTGYTLDPQESINYVSAHDNQTLFDIMQYRLPTGTAMADRVRANELALDLVALGQGVPFFHMADDLLRSKSMDKNSYDSGDWFNRIDWTGQGNGWRSGLPNSADDSANWPIIRPIFADASIAPSASHISAAATHFEEMLRLRKSSRLFRLTTGSDVKKRVDFLNVGPGQVPGVIVMTITDGTDASCGTPALADLDPAVDAVVVVFNADKASHAMDVPGAAGFRLHGIQASGSDPVVKTATVTAVTGGQRFTVPPRTAAVFVAPQGGAQGVGLPCNTR
jgi:pullulanase-type alpha-1,6-glucosidase